MSVQEIDAQTVRHSSGAEVGNLDRRTLYYDLDGRRLLLPVERGDTYAITLAAQPRWNDGSPLTAPEIDAVVGAVDEACRHWGVTAEFFRIDESQPATGIDDIVDLIVRSRPDA
jgi:hypothetical protein